MPSTFPTEVTEFADFYQQGGAFMHAILAVTIVGACVVLERGWQIVIRCPADAPTLLRAIQMRMLQGDNAGARRVCTRRFSAVGHVLLAGLTHGLDRRRAEAAVREAQMEVTPMVTRRIPLLSALASIAMLLGLLGTVFGLIGSLHGCGVTVSAGHRAAALATGISIAINTTGFGLLVSIALLSAQLYFRTLRDRIMADVALYGVKILNLVTVITEPTVAAAGSPYRAGD